MIELAVLASVGALGFALGRVSKKKSRLGELIRQKERIDALEVELESIYETVNYYRLMKIVSGAIKSTINAHGPIDRHNGFIGSAAKRVTSQIIGSIRNEEG